MKDECKYLEKENGRLKEEKSVASKNSEEIIMKLQAELRAANELEKKE